MTVHRRSIEMYDANNPAHEDFCLKIPEFLTGRRGLGRRYFD